MPSSLSAVLRSLILLAFLVGLPFLAVTGISPDRLIDRIVNWCAERLEGPSQHQETAHAAAAPQWDGAALEPPDRQDFGAEQGSNENRQTEPKPIADGSSAADPAAAPENSPARSPPMVSSRPAALAADRAASTDGPAASNAPEHDSVAAVEKKLQLLGASYYLLERWGHPQRLYRFQCRMPISDDPNHYTQFQAIDDQPLRAMRDVLRQIEAWRSAATAAPDRHLTRRVRPR